MSGCDTHGHVFDPARFPYAPGRRYTTPAATAAALAAHFSRLGLGRAVVVGASVHGTDNGYLLDALRQLGPQRARGVAVLGEGVTAAELAMMDAAGMRGARLNLEVTQDRDPAAARAALRRLAARIPAHWRICL